MKVNNNFILREIAGEYILIPVNGSAVKFNGLITLNETASTIFKALAVECTLSDLVNTVTAEYAIDHDTAQADVEEFLQQLRQADALVE